MTCQKKVLQRTDERQNVPFFFLWIQPDMWESWVHFFKTTGMCSKVYFMLALLVNIKWHLASLVSLKPYLHLLGLNRLFWNMSESKFASRSQGSRKPHWCHNRNLYTFRASYGQVSSNTFCFNGEIDDLSQIHIKICWYLSSFEVIFKFGIF